MTTTQQLPGGLSYFPRGSQACVNAPTTRDAHGQPLETQLLPTRSRTKGVTGLPNQSPLAQPAGLPPSSRLSHRDARRGARHQGQCVRDAVSSARGSRPARRWGSVARHQAHSRKQSPHHSTGGWPGGSFRVSSSSSPSHPLLAETGEATSETTNLRMSFPRSWRA